MDEGKMNGDEEKKEYTLTAWNTSIAGWPKSPFCPFSPGKPYKIQFKRKYIK